MSLSFFFGTTFVALLVSAVTWWLILGQTPQDQE